MHFISYRWQLSGPGYSIGLAPLTNLRCVFRSERNSILISRTMWTSALRLVGTSSEDNSLLIPPSASTAGGRDSINRRRRSPDDGSTTRRKPFFSSSLSSWRIRGRDNLVARTISRSKIGLSPTTFKRITHSARVILACKNLRSVERCRRRCSSSRSPSIRSRSAADRVSGLR